MPHSSKEFKETRTLITSIGNHVTEVHKPYQEVVEFLRTQI